MLACVYIYIYIHTHTHTHTHTRMCLYIRIYMYVCVCVYIYIYIYIYIMSNTKAPVRWGCLYMVEANSQYCQLLAVFWILEDRLQVYSCRPIKKMTLLNFEVSGIPTVIIVINIKDRTLWSVPSPQLQLLSPMLLRSSNCSPSLRSAAVWFQRDSVLWHSMHKTESPSNHTATPSWCL